MRVFTFTVVGSVGFFMFKRLRFIFIAFLFFFFNFALSGGKEPIFSRYALKDEFEVYLENGSFSDGIINLSAREFYCVGGIKGESCYTAAPYEEILNDFGAKTVFSEKTAYGISFYAFSPKIPYRAAINGKTVNIQYFVGENSVKIGTPLIFGGY